MVEIKRPDRRKNQVCVHTKAKGEAENLGVPVPGISTLRMFNAYDTGGGVWRVRACGEQTHTSPLQDNKNRGVTSERKGSGQLEGQSGDFRGWPWLAGAQRLSSS